MDILVIDIGGTSVKLWHTSQQEHRKFDSGKELSPELMMDQIQNTIPDWNYEAVALGMPCRVNAGRVVEDPHNLGPGWMGYNFAASFGKPVRIMNDACLQALGSFDGGRMLFLGLGTAVGSTFVTDRLILSLDLGCIRVGDSKVSDILGSKGFDRLGAEEWQKALHEIVPTLQRALLVDYVVLGGGNVQEIEELPPGVRRGNNRTVVEGGRKLWEELQDPTTPVPNEWFIL